MPRSSPPAPLTRAPLPLRPEQNTAPSARPKLTTAQLRLARHALGLPNHRYVSYRNRFLAVIDTLDHAAWCEMVKHGYATCIPYYSSISDFFHLTKQGATLALSPAERLDDEDFP